MTHFDVGLVYYEIIKYWVVSKLVLITKYKLGNYVIIYLYNRKYLLVNLLFINKINVI